METDTPAPTIWWAVPAARAWMACLVCGLVVWWGVMGLIPASRSHFWPASVPLVALWAFFLPDLLLVAVPSLYALSKLNTNLDQARWSAWFVLGGLTYSALLSLGVSLMTWQAPLGPSLMLPAAFCQAVLTWTLQPEAQWFREAQPASVARRVLDTVGDAVLFTSAFLLVPALLIRLMEDTYGLPRFWELPLAPLVGILAVLNIGGFVSGVWLVAHGDGTPLPVNTTTRLVVTGPYRWIRNPMAAFGIFQGLVLAVGLGSVLTGLYALIGGVVWHGFVRPIEERNLHRRFGDTYAQYRREVPLWLPIRGLPFSGQ